MRRVSFGILLLLLFGIATIGTGVVVYLLTSPEIRAGAVFRISCGALLLAGAISTLYGLGHVANKNERGTPLPTLFTFGTAAFLYDLFTLGAALTAWKITTFTTTGYIALHAGGLTLFLLLATISGMIATRSREELDDRNCRARIAAHVQQLEESARRLTADPETARKLLALVEDLRYSDPVSAPTVREEELTVDNLLGGIEKKSLAFADAAEEERGALATDIAADAERAREALKRRNARLVATK